MSLPTGWSGCHTVAVTQSRSSLLRGAVVGGLIALGILVAWVLITGLLGLRSAMQVQSQTQALTDQLSAGDSAAAEGTLRELQGSSASLSATFGSAPWTQVASLPLVGSSVQVFADIADGTAAVMAATEGQEATITDTVAELKAKGAAGVGALEKLHPFTEEAAAAIELPAQRVAAVSDDEIFAPLRPFTVARKDQFLGIAEGVRAAEGATVALPVLLGAQGRRTWLVSVQNAAEARGTGGLLSAYSIVDVVNGKLEPRDADTTNDLFGQPPVSLAGIPKDTQQLWGADQLGRWWGFNLDRHFPYAGLLMHRGSPVSVDDVVTIDARVVAGLMSVTGPVTAAGVTVAPDEAAEFFTATIYERFPDPERKDAVTIALINRMLSQLADANLDPLALWEALAEPASQGRLLTYSSDRAVQAALSRMPTGGVVPEEPGPWASAAINDFGGSKLSAYLQVTSDFRSAAFCPDPGASSTIRIEVSNEAPDGLPDYVDVRSDKPGLPTGTGTANVGVAVYAPWGSAFRSATVDGEAITLRGGTDRSHPVWQTAMELGRGESKVLEVEFEEPRVGRQPIVFSAQPMVLDMITSTGEAGC